MNREGDSPDYDELYNEIRSQNKLIDFLYGKIKKVEDERNDLLEALIEYVNLDTGNISALKTTPQQRKEKAINAINKATK